jgi:hypothetical protein
MTILTGSERPIRWCVLAALLMLAVVAFARPAAARNMLANSSFELGPDHRYAIGRWFINGLPNTTLDESAKVHGTASLKVPFSVKGYAPDGPKGIEMRGGVGVPVEKGKTYTFSIYLKTDVPDADASIAISAIPPYEWRGRDIKRQKITLGRHTTPQGFEYPWQRHSLTFTADKTEDVFWVVTVGSKRPGAIWADAVQFEEGPLTDYRPMLPVEIGLFDTAIGHIHDPGKPPEVALNAYNDGTTPKRQPARLRIVDDAGTVVSERILDVNAPAKSRSQAKITLDTGGRNGIFVAELTLPDGPPAYQQDTSFTVLPKPRPIVPEQSSFGAYITPSEEGVRIFERAGFHWTATLTSAEYLANWGAVESRQGQYRWHDADIDMFRRHGFEMMMNLEGWVTPRWAKDYTTEERTGAFARFIEAMARHYRGKVRYFNPADEIHNKVPGSHMIGSGKAAWSSPKEYAAFHKAAYAAAKRGNPDAQIVLNTDTGGYGADHLFQYMSPKTVDVLAGNYYPYPDEVRKLKKSAEKVGISTVWAPGVAVNTWPMYFRRYDHPLNAGAAEYLETMTRKIIRSFANGAQVIFHYTGTYVGNTNVYSVLEHDSSLETGGAVFASLAWLLDDFKAAHDVPLVRASRVEAYRFDRRDGNSVFAVWSKLDFPAQSLVFKTAVSGVRVYDHWTTEQSVPAGGMTAMQLGDRSRFFVVPTAAADAFEKSLSFARLKTAALPPSKDFVQAGRYAMEKRPVGRKKEERDLILWYDTGPTGWVELLQRRQGTNGAEATLDAAGLTLRFPRAWDGKAGHLMVGNLPTDAFWGARFWRSMPDRKGPKWETGLISDENIDGRFIRAKASGPSPVSAQTPIAYVFETPLNFDIVIETAGEQPDPRFPMPGGWNIYVWRGEGAGRWLAFWRYAHGEKPRERDVQVRIRVASRK